MPVRIANLGQYTPLRPLLIVFLISLVVRLAIFWFMLGQVDEPHIRTVTPDVKHYIIASEHILRDFDFSHYDLDGFGPGYPAYIALLRAVFADDARIMVGFNLLVSALGSLLLGLLAWHLTGDHRVAWLASLIHALSPSSIFLATTLLSDTVYFTLLAAGLFLFVLALKSDRKWLYILCGVWFGVAPLVRSIGTFFPAVLLVIAWAFLRRRPIISSRHFRRFPVGPVVTVALAFALLWGYTLRPREAGEPPISYAAYNGLFKVTAKIRSELNGTTYDKGLEDSYRAMDDMKQEKQCGLMEAFMLCSQAEFSRCAREHPLVTASVIVNNAWNNSNSEISVVSASLPAWGADWREWEKRLERYKLNYRHVVFALIGMVLLIFRRRWDLVWIVGTIYAYFYLTNAFVMGQGNRPFYPGMIAWSILAAYALSAGVAWAAGRRSRGV